MGHIAAHRRASSGTFDKNVHTFIEKLKAGIAVTCWELTVGVNAQEATMSYDESGAM